MTANMEIIGTALFAIAIVHTFLAAPILRWSHHFPKGSPAGAVFHLFGEVELVFAFWAVILLIFISMLEGVGAAIHYQQSLDFTEPIFVFSIMVIAATKPVMRWAELIIHGLANLLSKFFKVPGVVADVFVVLTLGPLAGSFITEPAAMTVTALLLNSMLKGGDQKLLYVLLGVLFVNVSIGGALTPFAAPPILMVAKTWHWDFNFIFVHFGWKSSVAVLINGLLVCVFFFKALQAHMRPLAQVMEQTQKIPFWVISLHYLFLSLVVLTSHYSQMVAGVFLGFLGLSLVTQKYQERLRIRESLLVAVFLGGIIFFGSFQKWWLSPLLASLDQISLYLGACALTAITDNAALTYLGSQVEGLSSSAQYFLVAGAIAGGGLTIIANAPNAAGFAILQGRFKNGLNPLALLAGALVPSLIAILSLGWLP